MKDTYGTDYKVTNQSALNTPSVKRPLVNGVGQGNKDGAAPMQGVKVKGGSK